MYQGKYNLILGKELRITSFEFDCCANLEFDAFGNSKNDQVLKF
jgi:hypothetical protein